MAKSISSSNGGYRWLDAWNLAAVIQLATQRFCLRFLGHRNDPCGRQFDQMTQAARSGVANIAEGYSRRGTSAETELRLYDTAKASLAELAGDFRNWLLLAGQLPWSATDPAEHAVFSMPLDEPAFTDDVEHDSAAYILAQYAKFGRWLDSGDSFTAARALLVLANRAILLLSRKMERAHADFLVNGGFAETLSRERIAARDTAAAESGAPACPECGKPMRKRLAKRGARVGRAFWSCSAWPECKGTRPAD